MMTTYSNSYRRYNAFSLHRQWFDAVRNYLMSMYGLGPKQADPSVRNESRACFLCYDPEVYVATSSLSNDK